jgi:hypothetical protein
MCVNLPSAVRFYPHARTIYSHDPPPPRVAGRTSLNL